MRFIVLVVILACGSLLSYGQETTVTPPITATEPAIISALQASSTPEAQNVSPFTPQAPPPQQAITPLKEEEAPMPLWRKIAGFSMLGFLVFWMFWRNARATKEQEQTEEES